METVMHASSVMHFVWIPALILISILIFFLPYWFVICRIFWHVRHESVHHSWNSPWFYWYWIVSAVISLSILLFSVVFYLKNRPQRSRLDETESTESTEHLFQQICPSKNYQTVQPFRLVSLPVQDRQVIELLEQPRGVVSGLDLSCQQVQPSTSKHWLVRRPTEVDFAWDHDNLPWIESQFYVKNVAATDVLIEEEEKESEQPIEDHLISDSASDQVEFDSLGVGREYRADFYQLTPTGSLSSSSPVQDNPESPVPTDKRID